MANQEDMVVDMEMIGTNHQEVMVAQEPIGEVAVLRVAVAAAVLLHMINISEEVGDNHVASMTIIVQGEVVEAEAAEWEDHHQVDLQEAAGATDVTARIGNRYR